MKELSVSCPKCNAWCDINLEEGELIEESTSEGFEADCACGCSFAFDVYVEIENKIL